jgi:Caspase domain
MNIGKVGGIVFAFGLAISPATALVRMAVIAGNNEGLSSDPLLRYAAKDAENVRNALEQLGGVDKKHSHLLLNADVKTFLSKLQESRRTIHAIKTSGEKVQLLIYYSGHGSQEALHLNGERLPLDRIRSEFKDLGADLKLLIADACFSGALLQGKGASLAPPVPVRYHDELKVNGSAILTSSSAGELAQESKELRGSLFTHYFLSAIRGAGDADHDGLVTLWEAYHYTLGEMRRKLAALTGVAQTPEFEVDLQGSESVILTRLSMGEASLVLKGLPLGRYQIFEAAQARTVAEVQILSSDGIMLSLPKGQYLVYRGRDTASESVSQGGYSGFADLRKLSSVTLSETDFQEVAPGGLFSKGVEAQSAAASPLVLAPTRENRRLSRTIGMGTAALAYVAFPGWSEPVLGGELFVQGSLGNSVLSVGILTLRDEDVAGSTNQVILSARNSAAFVSSYTSTSYHQFDAWGLSLEAAYLWNLGTRMCLRPGLRLEWWGFKQDAQGVGEVADGRTLGTMATLAWEAFLFRHLSVMVSLRPGVFWYADGAGDANPLFTAPLALGVNLPW